VLVISYPSIHEYVAMSSYRFPVTALGPTRVELCGYGRFGQVISTQNI